MIRFRNSVIGAALGDRNHNVTIFSPYFVDTPPKGVHYIFVDSDNSAYDEYTKSALRRHGKQHPFYDLATLAWLTEKMCLGIFIYSCESFATKQSGKISKFLYFIFQRPLKVKDFKCS